MVGGGRVMVMKGPQGVPGDSNVPRLKQVVEFVL